jgi:hypothetical protein
MGFPLQFRGGLEDMLLCERDGGVTWHDVWTPLKNAIDAGEKTQFHFNVSGYEYEPQTNLITVYGLLVDHGEVQLKPEDFLTNMRRFFRGAP